MRFDAPFVAGAHVFGNGGLGVLAETIPATGDNGASFLYNDLSLPADNGKEICGSITSWPSAGTLFAYEDGSFEFSGAPDGAYSFAYQLKVDGVNTGYPETVSLTVGPVPVTITGNLGTATASGYQAALFSGLTLVTNVGSANASGYSASVTVSSAGSIVCFGGTATASGYAATITAGSFSGSLSDSDIDRIVVAVLAALNATTIPVDIQKVHGQALTGDGTEANPWNPA